MRAARLKFMVVLAAGALFLTWLYILNRKPTERNKTEEQLRAHLKEETNAIISRKIIVLSTKSPNGDSFQPNEQSSVPPRYALVNAKSNDLKVTKTKSTYQEIPKTTRTSLHRPASTEQNLTTSHSKTLLQSKKYPQSTLADSTLPTIKLMTTETENSILQKQFNLKTCSHPKHFNLSHMFKRYHQSTSPKKFKFYIYELPNKFNVDIVSCFDFEKPKCYSFDHCGMGPEFPGNNTSMVTRDTHMFAAEVLLHNKLRFSPYRTLDADHADMFYIPAYIGLHCLCTKRQQNVDSLIHDLFFYLKRQKYFSTFPHFTTVAKISREMAGKDCPYLSHRDSGNITFLGIELELNKFLAQFLGLANRNVIQIPYPSYVHFPHHVMKSQIEQKRDIFILLAAGSRVNPYRVKIMNQFPIKTSRSYLDFKSSQHYHASRKHQKTENFTMVLFDTDTCSMKLRQNTIPWMEHSVFCLQPPGNSPTRKSFFDSILSGCIPVLFPDPPYISNPYPFQSVLNYDKFTVTIPHYRIANRNESVLTILKELSPLTIHSLRVELAKVGRWLQYSVPNGQIQPHDDALKLIIQELTRVVSLAHT